MRIPVGDYWIGGGGSGSAGGDGNAAAGGGGGSAGGGGNTAAGVGGGGDGGWTPVVGAAGGFPGALPSASAATLPMIALRPRSDGSGYRLPALCVDEGRDPPGTATSISHTSGGAKVQKYSGTTLIEEKPLNDAISGPSPWLVLSGLGAADEIGVKPTNSDFAYRIVVSDLTIAGENASDVHPVYNAWTGNPVLMETSKSLDALRIYLAGIPEVDRAMLDKLEHARQAQEWQVFGLDEAGAKIPTVAHTRPPAAWIDEMVARDFDERPAKLTASDRLDWFTLLHGKKLSTEDFKFLADRLAAIDIANSYDYEIEDSRLLAAFGAAAFRSSQDDILASFHQLRAQEKLGLEAAVQRAAFRIGNEDMWTTGRPGLATLGSAYCAGARSNGPEDFDTLLNTVSELRASRSEAGLQANLDLMRSLGVYVAPPDEAQTITVIADRDAVCFFRITAANKIERRQIAQAALDRQFILQNFKNAVLVVTDELAGAILESKNIEFSKLEDLTRKMSVKAFARNDNAAEERYEHPNRVSGSTPGIDFATLNLETKGDALVARLPDGSFLMVDTGLGKDTLSKLSKYLSRHYSKERPPLRLVITHSHEDHIGGLRQIADAGFDIQEMLVGRSLHDRQSVDRIFNHLPKDKKAVGRLWDVLEAGKTSHIKDGAFPGVTHFVKAGIAPLFDATVRRVSDEEEIESWSLKEIAGVQIDVHHVIRARTPNEGGLLVRLGYRGMHWLLCDDLNDAAWSAVANNLDSEDIRAGILKWPHHLWLPSAKEVGKREQLKDLLRAINPHTIIFSNTGHTSHNRARYQEIRNFVEDVLPNVSTAWTRDNGKHVIIQAEN